MVEWPAPAARGSWTARRGGVAWVALIVLVTAGCANQPPPVVISYGSTPAPVATRGEPTPASASSRRPADRAGRAVSPTSVSEGQAGARQEGPAVGEPRSARSATPTPPIPGAVSEEEGAFVTSSSHGSRYYYARADTGWHRIRADHRVWFASAADLLKVFPGRELHEGIAPTPLGEPTPTRSAGL